MASAVEPPKKRIRISYNGAIENFAIAQGVSDQDNVANIARAFTVSSVGLKVVDNQSSNVALTYDGLDANAEYKISTAAPLQAEADFFWFHIIFNLQVVCVNSTYVLLLPHSPRLLLETLNFTYVAGEFQNIITPFCPFC